MEVKGRSDDPGYDGAERKMAPLAPANTESRSQSYIHKVFTRRSCSLELEVVFSIFHPYP
jgi:hypothetical protein